MSQISAEIYGTLEVSVEGSSSTITVSIGTPGPAGTNGTNGAAATIAVGTTTTLAPGASATVTNAGTSSAAVFNFGIPAGQKGDTGDTGATGATGAAGTSATVSVGTTTTLLPGSSATVTNSGTSSAAVFNFGIPRGLQGPIGDQGPAGTIEVGTTSTGSAGTNASVTNVGTSTAAVFNFTIPRGANGDNGAGIATGGTTGQALVKASGTDFDTTWETIIPGDRYLTTSTTSLSVGNGTKSLTVGTGLSYSATQDVTIAFDTAPTFYHMHGTVTSYDSGTGALVVDVQNHTGSGTYSAWTVNVGGVTTLASVAWGDVTGTLSSQTDLQSALDLKAPKASPTFTGTPLSTTAAADTNTTQIATTAFVVGQASSTTPSSTGTAAVGTSLKYARADHVHANPLPTGGTANQVLSKVDSSNYNVQWVTPSSGGGGVDVQTFGSSTTSGTYTWTKPANAKWVEIILYGGGGGGGSGARRATSAARGGGGGGGGGGYCHAIFSASFLSSTETVVVGAGGSGGASQTVDSNGGNNGNNGGTTTLKDYRALGGNFGSAGNAGYVPGGAAVIGSNMWIESTTAGSLGGSGEATSGTTVTLRNNNCDVATGGGGGGGAGASSTANASGGNGGPITINAIRSGLSTAISGGTAGNSGTTPTPATAGTSATNRYFQGGTGGGGGYYKTGVGDGVANGGGAGGWPAGGGGGGGATDNGFASGAGGAGANGFAVIITYT